MTECPQQDRELKKKILEEKRERKMLERLTYYREREFRESTLRKKNQKGGFYSELSNFDSIKQEENSKRPQLSKERKQKIKKKQENEDLNTKNNGNNHNNNNRSHIHNIIKKHNNSNISLCNIEEDEGRLVKGNSRSVLNSEIGNSNFDIESENNNKSINNNEQNSFSVSFENNSNTGFQLDSESQKNKEIIKENKGGEINPNNETLNNNLKINSIQKNHDKNNKIQEIESDFHLEIDYYEKNKGYNLNQVNTQLNTKTYINCDIRYFNLDLLVSRIGHFDVILIDPPWRIKGGQKNDWSFMFSNSKFNLEYNTLSNNDIISLPLEKLSIKGFCFLWVLNSLLDVGYECLNKWGYDVVDQITWVKTRNGKVYVSQGYYFLHSSETCLVGYKCPPSENVEYKSKISSNIMFANVRSKSQKPDEIYEVIEKMMPGSKKVEIFARNNNLRDGWLSIGNQLGENFQQWKNILQCDICAKSIEVGIKRYKSKIKCNYDICESCFKKNFKEKNENEDLVDTHNHKPNDFFEFKNNIDEDVLHHYFSCNNCNSEPIWGNRFNCTECDNFDLCEACFDKELAGTNEHVKTHEFENVEIPLLANGMDVHNNYRCKFCFAKPIVGTCFICMDCKNYYVCQNCYFNSIVVDEKHFGKNAEHKLTLAMKSRNKMMKFVKCFGCLKEPIENVRYKCNNCFDFNLCEDCYLKRNSSNFVYSTNHKNYHNFTSFFL